MSEISLKSITGITSITTPTGVDNQLTVHNNNTTEAVKFDNAGNVHINNQLAVTGVSTFTGAIDANGDLDVDGHTNLDNVSIAGVTTTGNLYADNLYAQSSLSINNNSNVSVNLTSTSTSGSSRIFFGDPDSALVGRLTYSHNGDYMQFFTAYGERLRINSSGRVLIGTTNATTVGTVNTNLIVGSTTNNDEVGLTLNVMEGTNNRRVKFFLDDDDGVYGFDTTSSTGTAQFVVRHATSEKLRITSAGNVGINSATPTEPLEVRGNIFVRGATSSDKPKIKFGFTNGTIQGGKTEGNVGSDYLAISGNGGTNDDLIVNFTGIVQKSRHPSFYARRSIAGDGRSSASPVTEWVNPGSETSGSPVHNRGGHFNHTSGLFTAPVNGIYHFSAAAGYKQTNQSFNQKFRMNGVNIAEGCRFIGSPPNSHSTSTVSATMYMAAGDTMGVSIETTHHVNTTFNYFSGHLVA